MQGMTAKSADFIQVMRSFVATKQNLQTTRKHGK